MSDDFEPDAWAIRTTDRDGKAFGGFIWPREVGAIVTCPDWSPAAECGNGLHGLADGIGDYSLLSDDHDALWWIVGFVRAEAVEIGDKVKFPRCRVEYVGGMAGAMTRITQHSIRRILAEAKANTATGDWGHAAATGDSGHAAATGDWGHAAAMGDRGHAAAMGYRGHAAAMGDYGIAAACGYAGKAQAGPTGAIMLAAWGDDGKLVAVRAAMVGQDGIEPGVWYRLGLDGQFIKVGGE